MPKILVVEDEPTARYATARILTLAGFEVHAASEYASALRELDKGPMDLMVIDIVLPNGVNGFALGRMAKLRQADLKVLYMSAYDVADEEGAARVLRKPLSDAALLDEVSAVLTA